MMWAVVKENGHFAGVICESWEEARELAAQEEGRMIWVMVPDPDGTVTATEADEEGDEDYEPANIDDDCGYDPYMGCFTDDC